MCDNNVDPKVSVIAKIPDNDDDNDDDSDNNDGDVCANGVNADNGNDLVDTDEDGNEEEVIVANDGDNYECSNEEGASNLEEDCDNDGGLSDKDDEDINCNILSHTIASVVKSPPKKKGVVKVMSLPKIDNSHLKLDYDNLIFNREVIDGLESSKFDEAKPQQITSVKHAGKEF